MIKKGLKVKVLSGKDKNKEGEVIEIDRKNYRAKVKGINIVKKHVKTTKEKNKLKNNGIKTNAKGIKILKLSSKVSEFAIQWIPLKKKPKPKAEPKIKRFFLKGLFL